MSKPQTALEVSERYNREIIAPFTKTLFEVQSTQLQFFLGFPVKEDPSLPYGTVRIEPTAVEVRCSECGARARYWETLP